MRSPRPIHEPEPHAAALACLRAGVDRDAGFIGGNTALHSAAKEGRMVGVLPHLLAAGADPNRRNCGDFTPLQEAAARMRGRVDVLLRLLAAGGDPNAHGFKGYTALHWATIAAFDRVRPLELLLASGADVAILNNDRNTPLDVARRRSSRYPRAPVAGKVIDLLAAAGRQHGAAGTR